MNVLDLIQLARSQQASDLHLIADLAPALRINGEIIMANHPPLSREDLRRMVDGILSAEQKSHLESQRELCFSIFEGEMGRTRITVYFHAGNPELSLRLCSHHIPAGEALGLPPIINDLARKPNGLVLIAGPTGAGKTTTLNYMVDLINRERRCKIVSIEDPVEYVHRPCKSLIVQQEIHSDALSFPKALVHVLRQNPDVIVIGEVRELEAITTALTAAETGHLVLATLHTPNTMQTIERITAVFPGAQQKQTLLQLANCLQGVVTQELVPRADRKGRALAYEILLANNAVRTMIRENVLHSLVSVLETNRRDGMITKDQCLLDLYQKGIITHEAAIARVRNVDQFSRQAGGSSTTKFLTTPSPSVRLSKPV